MQNQRKGDELVNGKIKVLLIAAAVIVALAVGPIIVKAATDGEVDLYGDLYAQLQAALERIGILEARVAELEAERGETEEGEPTEAPADDPAADEPEGDSPEEPSLPASGEGSEPGDSHPAVPPEPEPYVNPYAHLTLDGVHVCTIDGVAHFARWLFNTGGANIGLVADMIAADKAICFTESEKIKIEDYLTSDNITYTVTALHVDPLFDQIVAGKIFSSRTKAMEYINSVIAGDIIP